VTELRNTISWRKVDNARGRKQPRGREGQSEWGSREPRKKKKRTMRNRDEVGSFRNIRMIPALQKYMTCAAEYMKVGHPVRVSWQGLGIGESWRNGVAV
jgi:hypothetical protein